MPTLRTFANPAPVAVPARVSLGEALGDTAAGGILASYRAHPAKGALPRHEHGEAYLCAVLHGGYEQRAGSDFECRRGSLVFHPAGHAHANVFGERPTRCVNLYYDRDWLGEAGLTQVLENYRLATIDPHSAVLARLEHEFAAPDAASGLIIAGAALDLLGQAARSEKPAVASRWLDTVHDAVAAAPLAPPGLGALAALAGVHPAHLSRAYRRRFGESPGEFARRLRLEQADAMLRAGNAPLAEIAAATGFCDQAHFARHYKRRFGIAPGAWRRQFSS